MEYTQHNPLPLTDEGPSSTINATIKTVFDWQYALEETKLMQLYEKSKKLNWNANELDWSVNVDVAQASRDANIAVIMNDILKVPQRLDEETAVMFRVHQNAMMLSQFLHGEQGALVATARIVETVPWAEAKFYAATQVNDEARHVEVYHRYLTEKLGVSYGIQPALKTLLADIVSDSRWDITYLGMQILVEGLALAAFGTVRMSMANEPLIQEITARIMGDESRHVAFGVLSLEKAYSEEMSSQELREREDFVIEASHLLYERLAGTQVIERLGWNVKLWTPWMQNNPMQRGMRQMMFSKIVPNLKRLGLLTPRVRKAYDTMGLLRFEHGKDSVEEPEVQPSEEVVAMFTQFFAEAQAEEKRKQQQAQAD